jgi:biotin transport system ATP-binding protein
MQRKPSDSPSAGSAQPAKKLPPIRMGDRSDLVRKEKAKAEEKHVAEDVALSLRRSPDPAPARAARVAAALERVGLVGFDDQPAHQLSGGEKQLLALASVLVADPAVLVCDEPTTLLDLANTRRVVDLLLGLPQQLVMVTHDLPAVAAFDRVLVLDRGRVVADDTPDLAVAAYRNLVG